ncbi:MAG TPA: TIGR04282 family arsenosugar biosynthesis glycosyltransferase [Pseudonocardia sp.]
MTVGGAVRRPRLLIMARAPVAGRTKTRLEPLLGPGGCARLQTALIRRTAALDDGTGSLAHTPSDAAGLIRPLVGPRIRLFPQRGGDLGERMASAVRTVGVGVGAGPVIVVGTDCPVLDRTHLAGAVAALDAGHDVVLGPAHDGGYYLIGVARPDPRVFAIPTGAWGGPEVAALTAEAVAGAGLSLGFLDPEHDLDTPADVPALLGDPRLPAAIADILRSAPDGAALT